MSRTFHYKTRQQLESHAEALGLDIAFQSDLAALFAPIAVAGKTVGNRLAILPMEGCDALADGSPGELTVRRFERFGDGGAKLIWGEACAVVPEGRANPRQLVITPANVSRFAQLVDATRAAHHAANGRDDDLLLGLQLTHSGRYSCGRPVLAAHDPHLDPRTIVDRASGQVANASVPLITDDELARLQDRYLESARLAHHAGFEFIDLKQCHRYLLNELLGARTRPGRYGGAFENRTRFILELVDRLRGELPDLAVATRLNLYDGLPFAKGEDRVGVPSALRPATHNVWGAREDDPLAIDLTEPLALAHALTSRGVSLIAATVGNPYASAHLLRPFEAAPPDAYAPPEHPLTGVARHLHLTATLAQSEPQAITVGAGYTWLQQYAFEAGAANVSAGRVAFMGMGRASLSQPDFARRLASGEGLDRKRICRTFSLCTALMRSKNNAEGQFPAGCPPFDKQVYGPIWEAARISNTLSMILLAIGFFFTSARVRAGDSPDTAGRDQRSVVRMPATPCEWVTWGNIWLGMGEHRRAIDAYTHAIELDPSNETALVFRAEAWAAHEDRERESEDYSRLIAIAPSNASYFDARGRSYSEQGRHNAAITDFNRAIALAPRNAEIWLDRGIEWRKDLKHALALADFEQAIALDPGLGRAYAARGEIMRHRKDYESAIQEYERLLRADPADPEGHRALARLLATCFEKSIRNANRAVTEAKIACELTHFRNVDCLDTLAAAYAEAGDFNAAVESQAQALKMLLDSHMGRTKKAREFDTRLALYKVRKPARE